MTPEQRATRDQLNKELRSLADRVTKHLDDLDPDDHNRIPYEFVLLVGTRYVDEEGSTVGTVYSFIDDESMPGYVARGLLSEAIDEIRYSDL